MNTISNVITTGYVFTSNGDRAVSAVNQDITTYAGWKASYRPRGIFFDEAAAPASAVAQYTGFVNTVRSSFGANSFVTLNPGTAPPTGFFSTGANLIVTFENFYSQFSDSSLVISSSAPASQQVILLHDAPKSTPAAVVQDIVNQGIAALFITSTPQAKAYERIPSDWNNFVQEVASV
ncbi:hypothetical protein HGRIS_007092 [Hohenbuehelia grisea]|uniref:Uncharacterized protein n=1 Tax=Hohenbuehelia grisea TaxID=104357 RepID=A0ABR3JBM9_9AGAR